MQAYSHNKEGKYKNGKFFANISVCFTTSAIFYGMLNLFLGFFITALLNFYETPACLSGGGCRFFRVI